MKRYTAVLTAAAVFFCCAPAGASAGGDGSHTAVYDGVNYTYRVTDEKAKTAGITAADGAANGFTVPDELDGYKITSLGEKVFFCNTDITYVKIPASITSVGSYAFSGCINLERAQLPDTLSEIGDGCFMSCTSLVEINLGDSIREIPEKCFFSCTALASAELPGKAESIGDKAFYGCTSLKRLDIPDTVKTIGDEALGRRYEIRSSASENIPGFVLFGAEKSAAEKYASAYGIAFRKDHGVLLGDVDLNGLINAADASRVLKDAADAEMIGTQLSPLQRKNADMNFDGLVDARDASMILVAVANLQQQSTSYV
ncbi:MAG: leucine-rich repeat protein [Ruminococcus sp.]|nr:leucine-rich repeat protein [Ruminococcus sp.]